MQIRKYIEHSLYAIAIQLAFILLPSTNAFIGFIAASFLFLGREMAQAENRYIKMYTNGRRQGTMRWWKVLTPEVWNVDSLIWDLMVPVIITAAIAYWV